MTLTTEDLDGQSFRQKLNSRKLLMAFGTCCTATLLLVLDHIEAQNWVTVVMTICGAYMATQAYIDKR